MLECRLAQITTVNPNDFYFKEDKKQGNYTIAFYFNCEESAVVYAIEKIKEYLEYDSSVFVHYAILCEYLECGLKDGKTFEIGIYDFINLRKK